MTTTMTKQRWRSNVNNGRYEGYGGDRDGDGNGNGDGNGDGNVSAATADGNNVNDDNGGIQGRQ